MKNHALQFLLSAALLALAGCDRQGQDPNKQLPPDNTGVNQRDLRGDTVTPLDQSESPNDLKITQQARQALMRSDALSFTAKNVKIITHDGYVTLRGGVKTRAEKEEINSLVRNTPGVTHVDDQLEVVETSQPE